MSSLSSTESDIISYFQRYVNQMPLDFYTTDRPHDPPRKRRDRALLRKLIEKGRNPLVRVYCVHPAYHYAIADYIPLQEYIKQLHPDRLVDFWGNRWLGNLSRVMDSLYQWPAQQLSRLIENEKCARQQIEQITNRINLLL